MEFDDLLAWRRQKLLDLAEKLGGKAELGRRLGYRDGAFVGQMIAGLRPITEKTIGLVDGLPGCAGWFAEQPGNTPAIPPGAIMVDPSKVKRIWVVGAGQGGIPERIWTDGDYPVGSTEEYGDVASSDPHAFLAKVNGKSMIPVFKPGNYALVEPGTEADLEDDVLVRLKTGETMIKRLLSRRDGYRFGSYNDPEILEYTSEEVSWIYYIAHPVPRKKIKARNG